jgi:hypothetical protein
MSGGFEDVEAIFGFRSEGKSCGISALNYSSRHLPNLFEPFIKRRFTRD